MSYTDWRVPNRRELRSLIDRSKHSPALPAGHPFEGLIQEQYWSSTTAAHNLDSAWGVSLGDGSVTEAAKTGLHAVWPVRGGPTGLPQEPDIWVWPPLYDFGSTLLHTASPEQAFEIMNAGTADLVLGELTTAGADAASFTIQTDSYSGETLSPGGICTVKAWFSPSAEGAKAAEMVIPSNDPDTPDLKVPLYGTTDLQAPAGSVIRTGQTDCFDGAGHATNCIGSGQDGENGFGVSWPQPRFMDHRDGTVTDKLTGLMWFKTGNVTGSPMTWQEALDLATDLNANPDHYGRGGYYVNYRDWRLPNRKELRSLIDRSQSSPALPPDHPFVDLGGWYWSSTTAAHNLANAWGVSFSDGSVTEAAKTGQNHVLLVRSGPTGIPDYPVISVAPESTAFGQVDAGNSSPARTFEIINLGSANLVIDSITTGGQHSDAFVIQNEACSAQGLPPFEICTFEVVFSPVAEGDQSAQVEIASNDPNTPVMGLPLRGTTVARPIPAKLWRTGLTACYDGTGHLANCLLSPQVAGSLHGVEWPEPRFTDNGDGTVTDHLTGLMWLKSARCFEAANWQGALDAATALNTNPLDFITCANYQESYTDWRLPNRKELRSLIDRSRSAPALPEGHPFLDRSGWYWSSTTCAHNFDQALGRFHG